jgi:hypothetical protein
MTFPWKLDKEFGTREGGNWGPFLLYLQNSLAEVEAEVMILKVQVANLEKERKQE